MSLEKNETEDEKWMRVALALASLAEEKGDVPIGCVVVQDGKAIAKTYNTREQKNDPVGHAEITAIRKASQKLKTWRLTDCTLYVTLEPCFMCAGAIVQARFKRVVFAAFDAKAGAVGSLHNLLEDKRLNHRCDVSQGICAEESSKLLKDFFKKRRKKN